MPVNPSWKNRWKRGLVSVRLRRKLKSPSFSVDSTNWFRFASSLMPALAISVSKVKR